jgi:hypothetical protein
MATGNDDVPPATLSATSRGIGVGSTSLFTSGNVNSSSSSRGKSAYPGEADDPLLQLQRELASEIVKTPTGLQPPFPACFFTNCISAVLGRQPTVVRIPFR